MKASSTLPDQGSRVHPSGAAGWTYDAFLKSAEACARPLIWARADWRLDQQHEHPLFRIRCGTGQRQRRDYGRYRCPERGAGLWPQTGEVPAGRRGELRRRVQQSVDDLWQGALIMTHHRPERSLNATRQPRTAPSLTSRSTVEPSARTRIFMPNTEASNQGM
jgi:hypothetical protein